MGGPPRPCAYGGPHSPAGLPNAALHRPVFSAGRRSWPLVTTASCWPGLRRGSTARARFATRGPSARPGGLPLRASAGGGFARSVWQPRRRRQPDTSIHRSLPPACRTPAARDWVTVALKNAWFWTTRKSGPVGMELSIKVVPLWWAQTHQSVGPSQHGGRSALVRVACTRRGARSGRGCASGGRYHRRTWHTPTRTP